MGSKQTRKQSASGRIALLQPQGEPLGPRGVGRAAKVRDPLRGDVILVTIDGAAVQNAKARRYFKRHLEAVTTLAHPGLVTVLDGGTDDGEGRPYLLQEPALGRTLRQVLADGPLPAAQALSLTVDLLNALAFAHARGVVHGGLTPEGVLVETTPAGPRARLLDLGFLRVVAEEHETPVGPIRVDADYAAPEMIKSEAADGRADLYSVGLLLQEMLTGKHPIPAPPKTRVMHRLHESAPDLPSGLVTEPGWEEPVRAALRSALHKNPARRFQSARAFALALRPGAQAGAIGAAQVVALEGGTCSACAAAIKPAGERPVWSRHESDQPFVCAVCKALHCGKTHWDARAFSCRKCVERAIPLDAAAVANDVAFNFAPTPTPAQPAAPAAAPAQDGPPTRSVVDSRRAALKGLLERDSGADWKKVTPPEAKAVEPPPTPVAARGAPDAPVAPAPAPAPVAAPRPPAAPEPVVSAAVERPRDAMEKIWADERENQRQARERTGIVARSAAAVGRPQGAAPEVTAAPAQDAWGWKVVTGGLALVLAFVIFSWYSDRKALKARLAHEVDVATDLTKAAQTRAEERATEILTLARQLDDKAKAEANLRQEKRTLEERLGAANAGQQAALEEKRALEAQLAEAARTRDALTREKGDLDGRLSTAAASLAELGQERASLKTRLEAASADRQALTRRLGEVESAQATLGAEREQLATRLEAVGHALDAGRAQREDLERRLRRALVRFDDQALDVDDLQLQLVGAARAREALAGEKLALEARLAEAQQILQAQEDLLTLLSDEPESLALEVVVDAAGSLLLIEPEAARSLLDAAAEERALVTLQVVLDAPLVLEPRVSTRSLEEGGTSLPLEGWRVLGSAADPGEPLLRAWLEPADAASLLSRTGGALAFLVAPEEGAAGEPRRVVSARLVASPLAPDVVERLRATR